jgi:hypothetical protein
MEFEINLAGLQPDRFSDMGKPLPTVLVWRLMDVSATAK